MPSERMESLTHIYKPNGGPHEIESSHAPAHNHPGEEIVYASEGVMEYRLMNKAPVTLKAGQVLFIPAGTTHEVKNVGNGNAAELASYVVEKGKPLVVLVK